MSQTIDIRIFRDSDCMRAGDLLGALANAVSAWGRADGEWQFLRVASVRPTNVVDRKEGPLTTLELRIAADLIAKQPNCFLSTSIGFNCLRFDQNSVVDGYLNLRIEAWDAGLHTMTLGDSWVEGHGRLTVSNARPYWAVIQSINAPNEAHREYNAMTEQNLESLLQLLLCVTDQIDAQSIKVYIDSSPLLPFNAHVLFYKDENCVITDIKNIAHVWNHGLANYKFPALSMHNSSRKDWIFSELRDLGQQAIIWNSFNSLIDYSTYIVNDDVNKVIKSGSFDFIQTDNGFFVMNYPYYFNSFMHDFYVQILNAAMLRINKEAAGS